MATKAEIERACKEDFKDSAVLYVYDDESFTEPVATFYATERCLPPEKMILPIVEALTAFEKARSNPMSRCYQVLAKLDNEPFTYTEYVYRLYPRSGRFTVHNSKRVKDGRGFYKYVAGTKIMDRRVERVSKRKEKPTPKGKGAKYTGHWTKPDVVMVRWGNVEYHYHLDIADGISKYLWLRKTAGENKAALWLKKNAHKVEKIDG